MQLDISTEEHKLLRDLAEEALRELKVEIRRTSTHEYQDRLKQREVLLKELVGRLAE